MKLLAMKFLASLSCVLAAAVGGAVAAAVFDGAVSLFWPQNGREVLGAVIAGASYGAALAVFSCWFANPLTKLSACAQLMQLFALLLVAVIVIFGHSHLQMRFSDIAPLVAMYVVAAGATLSLNIFGIRYLPRLFPGFVAFGDGPEKRA